MILKHKELLDKCGLMLNTSEYNLGLRKIAKSELMVLEDWAKISTSERYANCFLSTIGGENNSLFFD